MGWQNVFSFIIVVLFILFCLSFVQHLTIHSNISFFVNLTEGNLNLMNFIYRVALMEQVSLKKYYFLSLRVSSVYIVVLTFVVCLT